MAWLLLSIINLPLSKVSGWAEFSISGNLLWDLYKALKRNNWIKYNQITNKFIHFSVL